ncbi:uncharacterized protein PRCAT00002629001 [Priceomyces carsonii]|uniref:uncharacterized protein n=1 Tax=Priceomyces carsonii TaxID=28549 RepID=UPI002ED8388A|nr:unnamed protein product [Priceomyces carsonii]
MSLLSGESEGTILNHASSQDGEQTHGTKRGSYKSLRRPSHRRLISPSRATLPNRECLRIHNKLTREQDQKKVSSSVLKKLGKDELKSVKSHTELAETANGVRMLAKNLAKATIHLDVKAVMIVTKARDNSLVYLTREIVDWLLSKYKDIVIYVDKKLKTLKRFNADLLIKSYPKASQLLQYWDKDLALRNPEKLDVVLTLGGDGTVLYVSNLFQRVVPPVISFSLGSLGFLTNFKFEKFREKMANVLESGVKAYLRMRFTCRVHKADGRLVCEQQVLNELVVDRGPSPYLTQLELYGDGSLLTVAQADGLIIATPTGSTAYSLSAGGALVHPAVGAISVTPICPHTLSFRPILLPDGMFIKIRVPEASRSTAWASFDGKVRTELFKGDYVTVQASPFPFPTVISSKTEYIDSVSRNLNWNAREKQKPLKTLLDTKQSNDLPIEESDIDNLHIASNDSENFDINSTDDSDYDREDEDTRYLPAPGAGLNTPPSHTFSDDRTCYAHPNARISIDGQSSSRSASNNSMGSDGIFFSPDPIHPPIHGRRSHSEN